MPVRAFLFAFAIFSFALTTAQSQETPLQYFPSNTAFVARWHAPRQTQDQLLDTVESLDVGWSVMLGGMLENLGVYISNEDLSGVDENGDWWIAVTLDKNFEREVIFAIPSSNIDSMKNGLYDGNHFVAQGKWGIYTESEQAFEQIEAAIKGGAGLGSSIPRDVFGKQSAPGLQVVARLDYLRKQFPEFLMGFNASMMGAQNAMGQTARPAGVNDLNWKIMQENQIESMRAHQENMNQFLNDVTHYGVTITPGTDAIRLVQNIQFTPGSPTAAMIPKNGDCLTPLSRHPEAEAYYCTVYNDLATTLRQFQIVGQSEVLKASSKMKIDASIFEKVEALINDLQTAQIRSTSWSLSVNPRSSNGFADLAFAYQADDTSRLESAFKYLYEVFENDVKHGMIPGKLTFQEKSNGAKKTNRIEWAIPETVLQGSGHYETPQIKNTSKALFGSDPELTYTAAGNAVVGVIGDRDSLLTSMASPSSSAPKGDLQYSNAKSSVFVVAVDLVEIAQNVLLAVQTAEEASPAIGGRPAAATIPWNKVDLPKSYVTFDMTTQTSSADLTLTIPVQTLKNAQKLMPQLLPLFMRNAMSAQPAFGR